jgi:curved DNA-binding protein CbpA
MKETLYTLLRVSPDADTLTIRNAYAHAMAELRPRCAAGDEAALSQAAELQRALDVLTNIARRHIYDVSLEREEIESHLFEPDVVVEHGFWTPAKIMLAVIVLVVFAGGMRAKYVDVQRKEAEQAAARLAELDKKRAEMLAAQQRELKAHSVEDEVFRAEQERRENREIARLQESSRQVGIQTYWDDQAMAANARAARYQQALRERQEQYRQAQENWELDRRQREELSAAQQKLLELQRD